MYGTGVWVEFMPNPPWEEFSFSINLPQGTSYWIDDLHIATECVDPIPEPCTVLLIGTGLLGLAGLRKRGRK
jgi:hypothetical protein